MWPCTTFRTIMRHHLLIIYCFLICSWVVRIAFFCEQYHYRFKHQTYKCFIFIVVKIAFQICCGLILFLPQQYWHFSCPHLELCFSPPPFFFDSCSHEELSGWAGHTCPLAKGRVPGSLWGAFLIFFQAPPQYIECIHSDTKWFPTIKPDTHWAVLYVLG